MSRYRPFSEAGSWSGSQCALRNTGVRRLQRPPARYDHQGEQRAMAERRADGFRSRVASGRGGRGRSKHSCFPAIPQGANRLPLVKPFHEELDGYKGACRECAGTVSRTFSALRTKHSIEASACERACDRHRETTASVPASLRAPRIRHTPCNNQPTSNISPENTMNSSRLEM